VVVAARSFFRWWHRPPEVWDPVWWVLPRRPWWMPLVGVRSFLLAAARLRGLHLDSSAAAPGMAAVRKDARLWSGSSEPSATERAWRADQGEAELLPPTDDQIVRQTNLGLSAAGAYFQVEVASARELHQTMRHVGDVSPLVISGCSVAESAVS
jgi:hypothetical protein